MNLQDMLNFILSLFNTKKTINWKRGEPQEGGVFSTISLDWDSWTGEGLERPEVMIPAGTYSLAWHNSPHLNGARVLILLNVPGRSEILIHWGNQESNSDGCLLCGLVKDGDDIDSTQIACKQLFSQVDAVGVENVQITIQ